MPWKLRRIDPEMVPYLERKPGDWFTRRAYRMGGVALADLAPEFVASGRAEAVFIHLPGGGSWSPDLKSTDAASGWTLVFDAEGNPAEAHPSINAVGSYHGWLRDGELTDDIEGRTYDE